MKRLIKEIRQETGLSQAEFASKYGIPLSTLRKWEQMASFPAEYFVALLERTVPGCDKRYECIAGKYYLDRMNRRVSDRQGNWISFTEDVDGVMEVNLPVYFDELFEDFYKLQEKLNRDLKFDKIEKIQWR